MSVLAELSSPSGARATSEAVPLGASVQGSSALGAANAAPRTDKAIHTPPTGPDPPTPTVDLEEADNRFWALHTAYLAIRIAIEDRAALLVEMDTLIVDCMNRGQSESFYLTDTLHKLFQHHQEASAMIRHLIDALFIRRQMPPSDAVQIISKVKSRFESDPETLDQFFKILLHSKAADDFAADPTAAQQPQRGERLQVAIATEALMKEKDAMDLWDEIHAFMLDDWLEPSTTSSPTPSMIQAQVFLEQVRRRVYSDPIVRKLFLETLEQRERKEISFQDYLARSSMLLWRIARMDYWVFFSSVEWELAGRPTPADHAKRQLQQQQQLELQQRQQKEHQENQQAAVEVAAAAQLAETAADPAAASNPAAASAAGAAAASAAAASADEPRDEAAAARAAASAALDRAAAARVAATEASDAPDSLPNRTAGFGGAYPTLGSLPSAVSAAASPHPGTTQPPLQLRGSGSSVQPTLSLSHHRAYPEAALAQQA